MFQLLRLKDRKERYYKLEEIHRKYKIKQTHH